MQHVAGTLRHFIGGAARKSQQQDALGIGPMRDQARHAVRQRVGLAGPGAGDNQQRSRRAWRTVDIVLDGSTLLGIQAGERVIGGGRNRNIGHNDRHGELFTVETNNCTFIQLDTASLICSGAKRNAVRRRPRTTILADST